MLLSQPDRLSALAESLDTALLGCALTISVLQEQIGGLAKETEDGELKPKKFKFVLEQDHLKELLQQIRVQQVSITLMLQTYQRYEETPHYHVPIQQGFPPFLVQLGLLLLVEHDYLCTVVPAAAIQN